jgi:HlyD family secretion protein
VDIKTLLDEPAGHAWYRRTSLWAGVVLLIVCALGIWYWQVRRAESAAPAFVTQPVGRGNLTLSVTASGTLQPTRAINIGSELSGTVLKVNVDVNDKVTKGQVLVELDTAKLRDQILRSSATLAAANAKVTQTGATVREARATFARLEEVSQLSGGQGRTRHRARHAGPCAGR